MALAVACVGEDDVEWFPEFAEGHEVLLFDPLEERGQESIGDRYRSLDPSLRAVEVVVFRSTSASTTDRIASDPILTELLRDTSVLHLHRSYDPALPGPALTPVRMVGDCDFLNRDELRQAELEALLRRTESVFEGDNHHYLLPSGWHADRFVRLGNACSSLPANRRLADWLLGLVDDQTDLLADTGTILPLLQEVQRHCQHRFGWPTKIDALGEYPSIDSISRGLHDLETRSGQSRRVLFVISVGSSGTARTRFQMMGRAGNGDTAAVICETASTPSPDSNTLVVLPTKRWAPAEDGQCDTCGSPATVVINPVTYEPTATYKIERMPVSPGIAQGGNELFALLDRTDSLRHHFTSPRGTHYAVWVDTPKLLTDEDCASTFGAHLRNTSSSAELVLVPDGPATDQLTQIVTDSLSLDAIVIDSSGQLGGKATAAVQASNHVLVVDDAIVTGTTLQRVRRLIYHAAQEVGRNPTTTAAVLLARPWSRSHMMRVRRPYRSAAAFNVSPLFERLFPRGDRCPWCAELALLRRWYEHLPDGITEIAAQRIEELQAALEPVRFLGGDPSDPALTTVGSFFGDLSEGGGFAAAASATMEVLDGARTRRSSLSATILDLPAAMDAYFDPCLLIGILRMCQKPHVRFADTDSAITERYRVLGDSGEALDERIRCELAWAALREVVPADGVMTLLTGAGSNDARLLQALLELRSNLPL